MHLVEHSTVTSRSGGSDVLPKANAAVVALRSRCCVSLSHNRRNHTAAPLPSVWNGGANAPGGLQRGAQVHNARQRHCARCRLQHRSRTEINMRGGRWKFFCAHHRYLMLMFACVFEIFATRVLVHLHEHRLQKHCYKHHKQPFQSDPNPDLNLGHFGY